jgi:drug/metabolite transporter (DMT)-like permease
MTPARPIWLTAAPVIFLALWSGGFSVAKLGLQHAEPITFLALRYVCVIALLAPLYLIFRPPLPKTKRAWADVAVTGFLIQVVYFGLSYLAFKRGISAGSVAIIVCLQPILVGLVAPRFVGEKVGLARWVGLGLGMAGAALVIISRSAIGTSDLLGVIAAILALLGITSGSLWEKRFGVSHHPITANLIQYGVGAALTLPLAYATESLRIDWSWQFGAALAYLVIGNSLISMTLLLAMIRVGEVARVSSLFYMVPPLSALIAWPMLGEAMPPWAWAGMALAAVGVAIASRKPRAAALA